MSICQDENFQLASSSLSLFWKTSLLLIEAYILYQLFGSFRASLLGFLEEIGPGTDFVPTATLCWILEHTSVMPESFGLLLGMKRMFDQQQRQGGGGRRDD